MALSIIQSAKGTSAGISGTVITATLTSPPTAGNILLAVIGYVTPAVLAKPANWLRYDNVINGVDGLGIYWYVVQPGDSSTVTFNSNVSDRWSIVLYEITGADARRPINTNGRTLFITTALNTSSASVLPIASPCLPIAVLTSDDTDATFTSATSGWSQSQLASGDFHMLAAWQHTLTTDMSAQQITWAWTSGSNHTGATILLLIQPILGSVAFNNLRPRAFAPGLAR